MDSFYIPLRIDPMWPVVSAWRGRWDAARLAQCFNDMPIEIAQALLDAETPEEAAKILGVEFTE